jgi:hypothetical protein
MNLWAHFCHRYFSNYYSQAGYSRSLHQYQDGLDRTNISFVAVYRDFMECAKEFKAVIEKIQTLMKNWYAYRMF